MLEQIMTNEQKLDEIYQIVKDQESRRQRAAIFRFIKWLIIFIAVYFIVKNPGVFIDKLMDILMPLVFENMKTSLTDESSGIMKQFQELIPRVQ